MVIQAKDVVGRWQATKKREKALGNKHKQVKRYVRLPATITAFWRPALVTKYSASYYIECLHLSWRTPVG